MKVAFICDGLDPYCCGKVGCYKYPSAIVDDIATCRHTFREDHAKNGKENAYENGVRFKTFVLPNGELALFEEWSNDE